MPEELRPLRNPSGLTGQGHSQYYPITNGGSQPNTAGHLRVNSSPPLLMFSSLWNEPNESNTLGLFPLLYSLPPRTVGKT